jgi:hypothetical protein
LEQRTFSVNSPTSEKTKETSSQTDRYFLESVRQTSSRPQRPLDAEFENIKCIEGDLFMLSATFKF